MVDRLAREDAIAKLVSEFRVAVTIKLQTRAGQVGSAASRSIRQASPRGRRFDGSFSVLTVDETPLDVLGVRPDFMVAVGGARVGYVELKAPRRKVPTTWSPDARERAQWDKLRLLPNVLYSDGEEWAVYHYGEIRGTVAHLSGSIWTSGSRLRPADSSLSG